MDTRLLIDAVGWAGAITLLVAYGLVSARRMEGDSPVYQLLNLVGGSFLVVNTFFYGAFPSTLVNLVWIAIAIGTMARKGLAR